MRNNMDTARVIETNNFSTQLEDLKLLQVYIQEQVNAELSKLPQKPYSSTETKELYAAISKAQGEFKPVYFNKIDPYLDQQYTNLHALIEATRAALTKYGLAVIQPKETPEDGSTILHTTIIHSSGQWLESRIRILPTSNDLKNYESTLNDQKRHEYMSLLGIVPTNDPGDDNGEIAMIESNKYIAHGPSEKHNPKRQSMDVIAKHELEELERELKDLPDLAENLMDKLRIQSLADLPSSQYRTTLIRIRKIKEELDGRSKL